MKVRVNNYVFVVEDENLGKKIEEIMKEFGSVFSTEKLASVVSDHLCEIYECKESEECDEKCDECYAECESAYNECIKKCDECEAEHEKCYSECENACSSRRRYRKCEEECRSECDEKYECDRLRGECEDRFERCLSSCEISCKCLEVIEVRVR